MPWFEFCELNFYHFCIFGNMDIINFNFFFSGPGGTISFTVFKEIAEEGPGFFFLSNFPVDWLCESKLKTIFS